MVLDCLVGQGFFQVTMLPLGRTLQFLYWA